MSSNANARADRRQRRDDVRASVGQATLGLIETTPFNDVTVDDIARAAGLSRSAFYFYFRDKHDLLMALAAEAGDHLYGEADRWWHGEGSRPELIREALEGVARVYAEHASVLRVAGEVSTYDEDVRKFWRALVERFITATAEYLEREQAEGRLRQLDAHPTAEALVWMAERYCYVYLVSGERTPQEVVDALIGPWMAALYPEGEPVG